MTNSERSAAGPNILQMVPLEKSDAGHNLQRMGSATAPDILRMNSETGYNPQREGSATAPDILRMKSDVGADTGRGQNQLDNEPSQTGYQRELPGNDVEMGLNRSGDASGNSADQSWGTFIWKQAENVGTWLVTPTGNDVPEIREFVLGSGWDDYFKSAEIRGRRALMTPLGDVGINVAIAALNSVYPSYEAGRVIPGSVVGNFLAAYTANKVIARVNPKPYGVMAQAAVGQGVNLAVTKVIDAITSAANKH